MSNDKFVSTLQFREEDYPEVVRVANELADLEERKPHGSIKRLVVEEGQKKIDCLKAEKEKQQTE